MNESDIRQRLAAILAADAAGYSRLMAADERATLAALDAARAVFRQRIEAHQGRVIDMAGDSVLAVFETASGALQAALAIQGDLTARSAASDPERRMAFRVGVHLGDVIEKPDGTVYGDGVNIASRLEGLAEPGGVTVSDAVQCAIRQGVEASFEDLGLQQVKNIERPVRAFRVRIVRSPAPAVAGERIDKPTIAVLPLDNMSGDPQQEFFADGITEDIITELSRFRDLFVISRNSSFKYKGRAVDVQAFARELGVQYVVEGSVRKAGNRVRITVQLIDAETNRHLWAERYDRELADIFAIQDEVTQAIAATLPGRVEAASRPGNGCSTPRRCITAASPRPTRRRRPCSSVRSRSTRATRTRTPGRPACSARPGSTAGAPTARRRRSWSPPSCAPRSRWTTTTATRTASSPPCT